MGEFANSKRRSKYSAQFKDQALERAARDGVKRTAEDLGIAESMLYSWRAKRRFKKGRYAMIKDNAMFYPVKLMCHVLEVTHSGYYEWLSRKPSERKRANDALVPQIKKIFDLNKSRAGAVRVAKVLKDEGVHVGKHRVARLMRLNGWRAKAARKYKV